MKSSQKIIFNTIILYGRLVTTIGVSLYSTRLVLINLGAENYGIYTLVAGVIGMLSFLNAAMTTSTQRFLSINMNDRNFETRKNIFGNSLIIHCSLAVLIILVLLLSTPFLFNELLNIPNSRIPAAKITYQLMAVTVFFTVISVPYTASLNAHENMSWVALVGLLESILKLGAAICLASVQSDKLILYTILLAGISSISFFLYAGFCTIKYKECAINSVTLFNIDLVKQLTNFAGWNLFGVLCGLGRTQGLAIIINLFHGTIANAAYGIANQVSGQLNFFSLTLLQAINPQIMKSEGEGDRQRMLRLSMMASKFSFLLLALLAIPCIFEMSSILRLWLKDVPQNTEVFCTLILIGILTNQLTIGLQSSIQATGNIKFYQITVGSILLSNLPISFLLLYSGMPSYFALLSFIVIELIACIARLFILRKYAGLSIGEYANRVLASEIYPILTLLSVCFLMTTFFEHNFRILWTAAASTLSSLIVIYLVALDKNEKEIIAMVLAKFYTNFKPKVWLR